MFYCILDIVINGLRNNIDPIAIIDEDNYDKISDFMAAILNFHVFYCIP